MSPQCSVIVPLYNREKYIEKTLNSVLRQTFEDFELIVVDDASKDHSYEIVKDMAKKDPRIHVVQNEKNTGVADTRNKGINLASGPYVALLDSDDIWMENKLEKQVRHIRQSGCRLVYCGYGYIDREGNRTGDTFHVPSYVNLDRLLKRNVISCSTVLGERELFVNHAFDKKFYHEDLVAWISMLQECKTACGVQEELAELTIMKSSKSGDKRHSAKERWKIYRQFLQMKLPQATYYFMHYTYNSLVKYRSIRKDLR